MGLSGTPKVYIAPGDGPLDGTPTWVDVTSYVHLDSGIFIRRGRSNEGDQPQAGTCQLSLVNTTRRFDPLNTAGAYYPNLTARVPLKVEFIYNAVTYPLFWGFVTGWPQTYADEADNLGLVEIRAVDQFGVLAQTEAPVSAWDLLITGRANKVGWWPCELAIAEQFVRAERGRDGQIITPDPNSLAQNAVDRSGNGNTLAAVGTASVATLPGSSSLTAVAAPLVANGGASLYTWLKHLDGDLTTGTYPTGDWAFECWFQATPSASVAQVLLSMLDSITSPTHRTQVRIQTTGAPRLVSATSAGVFSTWDSPTGLDLADGATHHLMVSWNDTTNTPSLWVDGDEITLTRADSGGGVDLRGNLQHVTIGHRGISDFGFATTGAVYRMDEAVLYSAQLSSTDADASVAAGRVGSGQYTGERLADLLADWPSAYLDIATGTVILGDFAGSGSLLSYAQRLAQTELGDLYVSASGKITLRDRYAIWTDSRSTSSQVTLSDTVTGSKVGYKAGLRITPSDERRLANIASVSRDGGATVESRDTTSIAANGAKGISRSGLLYATDNQSRSHADYLTYTYADPPTSIENLVVPCQRNPTVAYPEILALELGDRVTVERTPHGVGSAISLAAHVEGISHRIGDGYFDTELSVSTARDQTWARWGTDLWGTGVWAP